MKEVTEEWRTFAKALREKNSEQTRILNQLKSAETQKQIIQAISASLQTYWQEQSEKFFGAQKQSMQQQAEQLVKQQITSQIRPLLDSLEQDHLLLQRQILELSRMLQR